MSSPKVRWELIIVLGGIGSVAVLGLLMYEGGPFRYSSICTRCGTVRQTTEWQLPATRITILKYAAKRETPVSLSLTTNRVVDSHSHQWAFAQGHGNGVTCALGRAHMVRLTVESVEVAYLIESLQRYGERAFRDKVLTNLFDEATTQAVRMLRVPDNGFVDAAQLHEWIAQYSGHFDQMVGLFKGQ